MNTKIKLLMVGAALSFFMIAPAMADNTTTVTQKTSLVNPDGSVAYESHSIETKGPVTALATGTDHPFVTFYYYQPQTKIISSAGDLTDDVISLWDTDHNKVIDNHEFYTNAMVMYEPIEYSKRTYQDIDGDGVPELTKEEFTSRLQQMPAYSSLNKDKKEGLTLYEFTGVGFQDADNNNDNQVSYDELKRAFYHQAGLIPKPLKINH